MSTFTHEDILERYINSLQRGEVFDWSLVPDDAELLSSLKLARGFWTESRDCVRPNVRPTWERMVASSKMHFSTPRRSFWRSFEMFGVWRIAAVSMAAFFGVVVLVGAASQGDTANPVASVWNRVVRSNNVTSVSGSDEKSAVQKKNVNSGTIADADTPAPNQGILSDPGDATLTNDEDPTMGITNRGGGAGALVTTLDVVDLDPEDNMNQLIKDFANDFDEMANDATDDGLKDMSSDIVLVNF